MFLVKQQFVFCLPVWMDAGRSSRQFREDKGLK
nr:MAG TPA: hypothetical protein [Caudoviricetes sp.]